MAAVVQLTGLCTGISERQPVVSVCRSGPWDCKSRPGAPERNDDKTVIAITHHNAIVNGVRLHYVEAGDGPVVVLLHGFPEFWFSWRHQIPALAAAGYRVLAPDLRGYNESDKPAGVANYHIDLLSGDVAALIRHAGADRASVVGHDWGGAIAWDLALRRPEVIDRLIVLNAPHPVAFLRDLRSLRQLTKSWYILFFQLPWLPELLMRRGNFTVLDRTMRHDPHRDAFSEEDIQRYKEALARPGALTAAINYYRAVGRRRPSTAGSTRAIHLPTLLIWGERDRYLDVSLTRGLDRWVTNLRIERLSDASHWVQNDAPDQVNDLIIHFLRAGAGS
jgi:pimeloyl-ACP methyl ester carboxylesterase